MGETTKNMLTASALRGYPPALSLLKGIAPYLYPEPGPGGDVNGYLAIEPELRCRRIRLALKREKSPIYRVIWKLFPPIG